MKRIYLSTVAALAVGYSHGRTETVWATTGKSKTPIRVDKSAFEADQEGDKIYREYKGKDPLEQGDQPTDPNETDQREPIAASSVDVEADDDRSEWLVMKSGTGKNAKFYIADKDGVKIIGETAKSADIYEHGYENEDDARTALDKAQENHAD